MPDDHSPRPGKTPPRRLVDEFLKNPTRQRIVDLLEDQAGMNMNQLAKTLGINITGVEFHVQRMARIGLVETRRSLSGRETLCFTPDNARIWDHEPTRILYGRGSPRAVALFLAENPGASVGQISRALGAPEGTIRRHMKILVDSKLAQKLRVERRVIYHAEPELQKWADEAAGSADAFRPDHDG